MFCTENTLQLPCSITIYKKVFEPFETFFKTKYSRLITLTFSFYATFDLQSTWLEWFTVLNSRFIKIGIKKTLRQSSKKTPIDFTTRDHLPTKIAKKNPPNKNNKTKENTRVMD